MAGRTARLFLSLKHTLLTAVIVALTIMQVGCSSVFFYPDDITYVTPDRLNLDYEDIYLDTVDGETLHGWWLPAQVDEGEPRGTVYFLHGNAQNISSHILNVAWLPEQGYNVFTIDYRGFGQSTGDADIEGALHDVETGFRWMTQQAGVKDRPIHILGQSLGGALGIALASEWVQREERPALDGIILDGTFSGFRRIAREKLDAFWMTWPFQVPLSWTIPAEYEGLDRIDDISPVPVMVIHSVRDGIIPFHHGVALYEAAEEPKRFLRTDTGHGSTFVIPAYREAVLEFMGESEGAGR